MKIEFAKMEGAGNDFILIDNRDGRVPAGAKRRLALDYCRRAFGIGADGMIFVEKDPEFDFAWDFYNSDGSAAEMCGNGARCAARFAHRVGAAGERMTFRTLAGPIRAELTPRGAKVGLTDAALPAGDETIEVEGRRFKLWFLNTGVPHAVIPVEDLEKTEVRRLGALIRQHPRFRPAGTNVNFIIPLAGDRLAIRTYERGVEDETMACGTGSTAACLVAGQFLGKKSPISAATRGGGELLVHFTLVHSPSCNCGPIIRSDGSNAKTDCVQRPEQNLDSVPAGGMAKQVHLEGGAKLVFEGFFPV